MKNKKKHNNKLLYDQNYNQKYLTNLPRIFQETENVKTLYSPKEFFKTLLSSISQANYQIYLVALYLEHDQGGKHILEALFKRKKYHPQVQIKILIDWHRAHRKRIGIFNKQKTNFDWYYYIIKKNYKTNISVYTVPINFNEALGVLHLKGFIIDDQVLYSGANINNEYLHIFNKYRYDRYHIIRNKKLSETMKNYIEQKILSSNIVNKLEYKNFQQKTKKNKNKIRLFRKNLKNSFYSYHGNATINELSVIPLVGLGKKSTLNQVINHLIYSTKKNIILSTPYFNMPNILIKQFTNLLYHKKNIEIIVGDKTANDFYISEKNPFKLIGILPYLYEINLKQFLKKFQKYLDNKQLIIRLWKKENNGYHIKGIWIDEEWQLLTGNNLNLRAWKFDLENAILIHDPKKSLLLQNTTELNKIRTNTTNITHYNLLQNISDYPKRIKKIICRIRKIRLDRLINQIL